MVAVHGVDFPLISLNHRHGDFACVDSRLQRLDLFLIAAFKNRQLRLRSCKFCQLAIDFWRAPFEMINAHRGRNFFKLFNGRITGRFCDDQVRLCRHNRFNINISGTNKGDR